MADGDWTAEPDEITVPPDAADDEPRLYIGPNDPLAADILGQNNNAIMFYWADRRAFMIFSEDNGPDFGALRIWSVDDQPGGRLIQWIEMFHDVNDPEFAPSMVVGGNDLLYSLALRAQHTIELRVGQKDGHPGTPAIELNPGGETDGPNDPDLKAYGISLPRGKRNGVIMATSTGAVGTTETVIATFPNMDFRAGRAYEMRNIGIATMSAAANTAAFRFRKTNTAGQQLANYGNWGVSTTTGEAIHQTGRVFTVGSADVNATIVLTAQASAGTVTVNAGALFPRKAELWDCGAASDFPTEPVLV